MCTKFQFSLLNFISYYKNKWASHLTPKGKLYAKCQLCGLLGTQLQIVTCGSRLIAKCYLCLAELVSGPEPSNFSMIESEGLSF